MFPYFSIRRRFDSAVFLGLLVAAFAAYGNTFRNEFVWDDYPLIVQDYQVRSPRHLGEIFRRDFFGDSDEELKYGYFRPLITLSYLLDFSVWRLNPVGFHLSNLLFHILNGWLVYVLARKILPAVPRAGAAAALLFVLHPVHTESVSWIAGRTDLIAAFFLALSLLLFLARRGSLLFALSLFSFALSLLAKEMALILPPIIIAHEVLRRRRRFLAALKVSAPYWGIVAGYLLLRFGLARVNPGVPVEAGPVAVSLSALAAFWRYLGLLLWPLNLSIYIRNPYLTDVLTLRGAAVICISACACFLAWRNRSRRGAFSWTLMVFVLCFLPLANVVRISAPEDMGFPIAERFLYLPSIFFALLLPPAASSFRLPRSAGIFLLLAVALAWGGLTRRRNRQWRDEGAIFMSALGSAPDAYYPYAKLGEFHCRGGRSQEGIRCLEKARDLQRRLHREPDLNLLNNLAAAYRLAKEDESALSLISEAIARGRSTAPLEYNRGMILLGKNRLEEARTAFERSLDRNPHFVDAWLGLGQAFLKAGRSAEAVPCFEKAVPLFPSSAELHNRLGVARKEAGDYRRALEDYDAALRLDPSHAVARANRGVLFALLNDHERARLDLEAAVAIDPGFLSARNALGMVYAKLGDPVRARETFDEILKAAPENMEARLNLGVLFFQRGDPAAARREFEEILARDPGHSQAARFLKELDRYPGDGGEAVNYNQ